MKKVIIISLIAALFFSISATTALAGDSHRHGWVGAGITIGGCGPVTHVRHFSLAGPPPIFFPVPPPFYHKTVTVRRGACYCGAHYKSHHKRDHGHWKHHFRHGKKGHSEYYGNGKCSDDYDDEKPRRTQGIFSR